MSQLVNSFRKCMVCNATTDDLNQTQCNCGAYMYVIGTMYSPTCSTGCENRSKKTKKIAPVTLASFGAI